MFKYTILKETQSRDGLTFAETVLETKEEKEVLEKFPQLQSYISQIKRELQQSIEERKQRTEEEAADLPENMKLSWIYSPISSRLIFDTSKAPDEYLVLETEYYPIDIVLSEIEKRLNKKLDLTPNQRIYVAKQDNRILLKQYDPQKKYSKAILNIKYNEEIETLLQLLQEMWNS